MTTSIREIHACSPHSAGLVALLPGGSAQAQQAQAWPQRSVKFILPFGPGSATDIAARLIGDKLTAKWGKPVVIENRPGADGLVAINAFTSAADDHVLLYASSASFIAHPYTQEKVPYDLERDLAPIAPRQRHRPVGRRAGRERRQDARANSSRRRRRRRTSINFAGAAGLPEFAAMAFVKTENLGISKIPYKDVVQAGRDLGENRIQFLVSSLAAVQPLIAGRQGARGRRRRAHAARAGRADGDRGGLSVAADRDHVGVLRAARHAAGPAPADRRATWSR